ncbi:unnamed protein product [Blepharisma stoltei]|uniref:Uncharacterized protein n=1 Tax=Blepharisma stoltei TaxID=1481888 RepID=A0AAU9K327_9CILI|nr:unnamed protein product [Blepharisma stoltei]
MTAMTREIAAIDLAISNNDLNLIYNVEIADQEVYRRAVMNHTQLQYEDKINILSFYDLKLKESTTWTATKIKASKDIRLIGIIAIGLLFSSVAHYIGDDDTAIIIIFFIIYSISVLIAHMRIFG